MQKVSRIYLWKSAQYFIDDGIYDTCTMRMPFCDKAESNGLPSLRPYLFYGIFSEYGKKIQNVSEALEVECLDSFKIIMQLSTLRIEHNANLTDCASIKNLCSILTGGFAEIINKSKKDYYGTKIMHQIQQTTGKYFYGW